MKTLIVIDHLNMGGIASSLYNCLQYASGEMECSLLVFNEESINYDEIPSNVTVLKAPRILGVLGKNRQELLRESIIMALCKAFLILYCKITNGEVARKLIWPFIKRIGEFDLAISYAQDDSWKSISKGCNDYIIRKVVAKHKASVVHCDYQHFGGYSPKQQELYAKFDSILCVSESCKKSFVECFCDLKSKVHVCENFANLDKIYKQSEVVVEYPDDSINFVSVCRIDVEKGLFRALDAFYCLTKQGYTNFTWTIVGDGPEYNKLYSEIIEKSLQDKVFMAGAKKNPYPYIKNASVFLLPSFHEAAPMVFGESAALNVPILSTRTCSADEMVNDRGIGIVVDNSNQGLEDGIRKILSGEVDLGRYSVLGHTINERAKHQFKEYLIFVEQSIL